MRKCAELQVANAKQCSNSHMRNQSATAIKMIRISKQEKVNIIKRHLIEM